MDIDVKERINKTIIAVCEQIEQDNGRSGEYAERIKALAELIQAKAYLEHIAGKVREGSLLSVNNKKTLNSMVEESCLRQKLDLRAEAAENQDNVPQITVGGKSIEDFIVESQR